MLKNEGYVINNDAANEEMIPVKKIKTKKNFFGKPVENNSNQINKDYLKNNLPELGKAKGLPSGLPNMVDKKKNNGF